MPWGAADAKRHTKKASSPAKKRQWAHVANSALGRGHSEGSAVRQANAVVGDPGRATSKRTRKRKRKKGGVMKAAARIMERRKAKKRGP
jgi:hypothetical protein